ncbi:MAG: Mth938-like domain-containing protein [Chloroflexi bacterium]|nr:Mth938-like domain-containing protein [Chloroflexota bacterium]
MQYPRLEETGFGWVQVDGVRYEEDILITAGGEVKARPKELSRKYSRGHTPLGPEEIAEALVGDPQILVIGAGQFGDLPIMEQTQEVLRQRGVEVHVLHAPQALELYNRLAGEGRRLAAIIHVTC